MTNAHTVTIYPELDRYREVELHAASGSSGFELPYRIATQDLPPPTPLFSGTGSQISGFSGSPSTRFSESPGPGPYSRDTTPTSISSQSPGLVAPVRIPVIRARQGSRGRSGSISNDGSNEAGGISADINPHTLAAIRESLTSSSSSSNGTVRNGGKKVGKKTKRLSPPPPSPPPRKSSQKFKKARDEDDSLPKTPREPAQPVMTTDSPAKATTTPQSPVVTSPRAAPPVRPSRDGTPDLQAQLGLPMPIIHSNLSSSSLADRRASATLASSPLHRSATPSSQPDRHRRLSRLPVGREPTPVPRADGLQPTANPEPGKTTRTPSPSVSTFRNRFTLFGRRTKTAPEAAPVEKKVKPTRKGPVAGTGHEGYGRIGSHRRKSSTASSNSAHGFPVSVSSQESLSSLQSYDPFLMERVQPVVIAGGEIIENRNTSAELSRTESSHSFFGFGRPSVESRNNSQASLSSREDRNTLWPSVFPHPTSQVPSLGSRRPSDSSDSEVLAMKPTLAFRRSIQRLRAPEETQVRVPKPIVVRPPHGVTSPSINSLDTSVMSDDSALDPRPGSVRGRKDSGPSLAKKLTKRTRSPRRWNFFGRSQSQPATAEKKDPPASVSATRVKVVPVHHEPKPVAFYTMMDSSEQEDADVADVDVADVKEVLREAQVLLEPSPPFRQEERERRPSVTRTETLRDLSSHPPVAPPTRQQQQQQQQPPRLGQGTKLAPIKAPLPARQAQSMPAEAQTSRTGRPSRLPQVGRIPKVVSARPEQASPKSFSRPFNRVSVQMPLPRMENLDADSLAKGPSPPKPSTPELTQEGSTLTEGTADSNRYRLSREFSPDIGRVANDFLSFSPRKGSGSTSCTTSTSSAPMNYAAATAVVPEPNAPLVEDEIWDEYNDLLGEEHHKMLPLPSGDASRGMSLQKMTVLPIEPPTVNRQPLEGADEAAGTGRLHVTSSIYSTDLASKITEALEAYQKPLSVTELSAGNNRRNSIVELGKTRRTSRRSSASSNGDRKTRRSDDSAYSQGSEDNSPLSQVNLRVGSMTVSKWLTFGHVLFSPARDELVPVVGSLKRHSILVIDGLGNDDWSFYAAETYPAATFFNLSPRAPLPAEHQAASALLLSPPNHHQIQYTSHTDKFPFAPESFTTVVFRFPAAAPESHYRNIISEARRVLKPGGYIELSILDLDLNNMGSRARRAVRRLKERIHAASPDINIGSTADSMLRLLNTKSFADIKSCSVGLPVASSIASSGSSGSSSRTKKGPKAKKDDRSLAEMMSDESPVADESITNMVAKVGRWWYSRCYETSLGASVGSLWGDRMLLAECEEWRTSLKLMVCYARVPDIRRMASI